MLCTAIMALFNLMIFRYCIAVSMIFLFALIVGGTFGSNLWLTYWLNAGGEKISCYNNSTTGN